MRAKKYTCDSCGKTVIVENGDEPPQGLHMKVTEVHPGGAHTVDVFICVEGTMSDGDHVLLGINNALART